MGFGWTLLGYFFVATVSMTSLALRSPLTIGILVGYPMMIFGLYLLAHYHRYFRVAFFSSFLSLPFTVYYALQAIGQFGLSAPAIFGAETWQSVELVHFVFLTLLTALILLGVAELCREVGLERHRANAWRDILLSGIATVLELVARLPFSFVTENQGYFMTPALLMRLAVVCLNIHLLFSCFRDICSEEEKLVDSHKKREKEKKQ